MRGSSGPRGRRFKATWPDPGAASAALLLLWSGYFVVLDSCYCPRPRARLLLSRGAHGVRSPPSPAHPYTTEIYRPVKRRVLRFPAGVYRLCTRSGNFAERVTGAHFVRFVPDELSSFGWSWGRHLISVPKSV